MAGAGTAARDHEVRQEERPQQGGQQGEQGADWRESLSTCQPWITLLDPYMKENPNPRSLTPWLSWTLPSHSQ